MVKEKLTIIGAGISGLYLAYLLEDKYEVRIIEARDRIGGRIHSIDSHDLGPSWVWSHHTEVLKLLENFNLKLIRQYTKGYALYDTPGKVERFNPPASSPSFRVEGSLNKLIDAIKNRLTQTKIHLNEEALKIEELDDSVLVSTLKDTFKSKYVISTLTPRLTTKLQLIPSLPHALQKQMDATQTWMGNSAKCVIEFKTAFWKQRGLSGFVFSNIGPLGEIHDVCVEGRASLFGFVNANTDMKNFHELVREQLKRVFDIEETEVIAIHLLDWREEKYTASKEDAQPLRIHPSYGIDTSAYSEHILFSSTEFSFEEGGYLEGAIKNAQKIMKRL